MGEVIDIQEKLPIWEYGAAICLDCKREFVAVVHMDTDTRTLQCSSCGERNSIYERIG